MAQYTYICRDREREREEERPWSARMPTAYELLARIDVDEWNARRWHDGIFVVNNSGEGRGESWGEDSGWIVWWDGRRWDWDIYDTHCKSPQSYTCRLPQDTTIHASRMWHITSNWEAVQQRTGGRWRRHDIHTATQKTWHQRHGTQAICTLQDNTTYERAEWCGADKQEKWSNRCWLMKTRTSNAHTWNGQYHHQIAHNRCSEENNFSECFGLNSFELKNQWII